MSEPVEVNADEQFTYIVCGGGSVMVDNEDVPALIARLAALTGNPHGTCIDVRPLSQSEPLWVCGDLCPRSDAP